MLHAMRSMLRATDPKELLMVLAPSVGSSKGHYEEHESFES